MASIVLSTVGRAVGAQVGGTFGAQLGAQLGGLVGGQIGGGSTKHTYEGARLETLAVQTSTYGRMIPMVFGTVRIAGNVIWSRPIKELATTTRSQSGGKGGGGARKTTTTSTEYSYYATLAIAVCEGELTRVDRVWADSKLLDLSLGTYRVYRGTETQLPDPLIESFQGVGATPAYRGMAYVVIEDFPLANYGNRIPNFTFEVTRRTPQKDVTGTPVESLVTSLMLIPGSGEFVYDTQSEFKISGTDASGNFVQNGYQVPLNQHTSEGRANVLVALDQMQQTFPNLEWVGVVVNWFGTSTDIASCDIWPCVEFKANVQTTPDDWQVAGFTRATAREIGTDLGKPRYGGTPDDGSILRLLDELRRRGLKVFFYPMLLLDIAGKPWRGNLTGAASEVNSFFTKTRGYNAYIMYYANLVAGKVDAFAIGTEMRDLTAITNGVGMFPAVTQLVNLATSVKAALGLSVKVTYAADWSEYHSTVGGWYHLDPLWASSAIDAVGIDAYFPISDGVQTGYDIAELQAGWTSGEGYDWIYSDVARTTKVTIAPKYAWKNIAWWWNNTHVNPGGATTAWMPGSKPVWFTEYGFSSVDGSANQPNVFVDASTSTSAYPRFSRGRIDFMAQRTAIAATEAAWAGSSMVTEKFLWTWDARPYPYWPDLRNVWADGANWVTGHWVQGKLGASHVAAVVEQIASRAGLSDSQVDSSALQVMLDGFVINTRATARAVIDQLMQAYFFSIKETGEALKIVVRDAAVDAVVDAADCVPRRVDAREVAYTLERQEDVVLPNQVEVQYLNRLQRYEANIQRARRSTTDATDTATVRLSLVLSEAHARAIADTLLSDRWAERNSVTLQLPISYAALEPWDVIELRDGAVTHRIRVTKVQIGRPGLVRVRGVVDAAELWDGYILPTVGSDGALVLPSPATRLEVLDMPAFPNDASTALTLRVAACGISDGWTGASITRVLGSGDDEVLIDIASPAIIGSSLTALGAGDPTVFDEVNHVEVALLGEVILASATEEAVLNGANVAMLGEEVIQFAHAEALGESRFRLSKLLRGRLGTEEAIATHAIGERFVLLNEAVKPLTLAPGSNGQVWTLRASSFGASLGSGTTLNVPIVGNSLKPLSPVQISARRDAATGDVSLRWVRRTRQDGALRDHVDVPLNEASEQYDVEIYNGAALLRSWRVTSPTQSYTAAEQLADLGVLPSTLTVSVSQLSAIIGRGKINSPTIPVQ